MKTATDTIVRILKTGSKRTANRLIAWLRRIVRNISTNRKMAHKTPEQLDYETKSFILKTMCFVMVMVATLLAYGIVFTEQPLFIEAPADKAIIAILSMTMAQIFTVLSLVLTGKSPTPPAPIQPPYNPCMGQPMMGQSIGYSPMATQFNQSGNNSMAGYSIDPGTAWTPPPPPTTPPTLEHEEERERMAAARREAV